MLTGGGGKQGNRGHAIHPSFRCTCIHIIRCHTGGMAERVSFPQEEEGEVSARKLLHRSVERASWRADKACTVQGRNCASPSPPRRAGHRFPCLGGCMPPPCQYASDLARDQPVFVISGVLRCKLQVPTPTALLIACTSLPDAMLRAASCTAAPLRGLAGMPGIHLDIKHDLGSGGDPAFSERPRPAAAGSRRGPTEAQRAQN